MLIKIDEETTLRFDKVVLIVKQEKRLNFCFDLECQVFDVVFENNELRDSAEIEIIESYNLGINFCDITGLVKKGE